VVICLERGADLHMAQLMPLPLTVSCSSKIQIGFAFLVPAHLGSPGQRAVKRVCVCVCHCCCCWSLDPCRLHDVMMTQSYGWNLQRLQHSRNDNIKRPSATDMSWSVCVGRAARLRVDLSCVWKCLGDCCTLLHCIPRHLLPSVACHLSSIYSAIVVGHFRIYFCELL